MSYLFNNLVDRISRFESWFNSRFGWFFINGMKEQQRSGEPLKA